VSRACTAIALLVAFAGAATAHWLPPEALVAELNGSIGRGRGVARAERDRGNPRLLVIRVGEGWYALPARDRSEQAAGWLERWRHSVPHGLIAVLDAESDRAVVRFGPGARVTGVEGPPRSERRVP
jgi:hypothetical protein